MKDLLDTLDVEDNEPINKQKIENPSCLDFIVYNFERVLKESNSFESYYNRAMELAPEATAKDIDMFYSIIHKSQSFGGFMANGMYITALINKCKEDIIVLNENKNVELNLFGYNIENKLVILDGDVDYGLGLAMRSGQIVINGNAGSSLGFLMSNGKIVVNGNVNDDLGESMCGGEINVYGDVGKRTANRMCGGTIRIYKNYPKITNGSWTGEIYYQDKLVAKDGQILEDKIR